MTQSRQSVTHNVSTTKSSKKKSMASLLNGVSVANVGQSTANLESLHVSDGAGDIQLIREKKAAARNRKTPKPGVKEKIIVIEPAESSLATLLSNIIGKHSERDNGTILPRLSKVSNPSEGYSCKTVKEQAKDFRLVKFESSSLDAEKSRLAKSQQSLLLFKTVDKYFRPIKNPILAKVEMPGILETESIPSQIPKKMAKVTSPIKSFSSSEIGIKAKFLTIKKDICLVADPKVVCFSDFTPNQSSVKQLTITNTSKFARRFRAFFSLEHSHPDFFRLSIDKTPTTNNGLVAPGLSCVYNVEFRPTSFAKQNESISVVSDTGEEFTIPVLAAREPPKIPLPSNLDIGYCREGSSLVYKQMMVNEGGEIRLMIVDSQDKTSTGDIFFRSEACLDRKSFHISPFEISPAFMYFTKGSQIELELEYCPKKIVLTKDKREYERKDVQTFRYICDDLSEFQIKIMATVQIPRINIRSYFIPKENQNVNLSTDGGNLVISFGKENVGVEKECILTVSNPTNLDLLYNWNIAPISGETSADAYLVSEYSKIFRVFPSAGTIKPLSDSKFTIKFLAQKPGDYLGQMKITSPQNAVDSSSPSEQMASIRLAATAVPFDPSISISAVLLPELSVGEALERKAKFTNNSLSPLQFNFKVIGIDKSCCIITIAPSFGILPPNSSIDLQILFEAQFPASIDGRIVSKTANGFGPELNIPILGTIKLPTVGLSFGVTSVELGLLKLGDSAQSVIPLVNNTSFPINYELSVPKDDERYSFGISPSSGIISAKSSEIITISYVPFWYQKFSEKILVHGINGSMKRLLSATAVTAIVETPQITIENNTNYLTCFYGVEFKCSFTLKNTRDLPATFNFPDYFSGNTCFKFSPSNGIVEGKKEVEIQLFGKSNDIGTQNFELRGMISEMVDNNGVITYSMKLNVCDPRIAYQIVETDNLQKQYILGTKKYISKPKQLSDAELRIDFGVTTIFASKTRTLKLFNQSAANVPFEVALERYSASLNEGQDLEGNINNFEKSRPKATSLSSRYMERSKAPPLLKTTIDPKSGFSSKAGQAYVDGLHRFQSVLAETKKILSAGNGAAFIMLPNKGTLQPWSDVSIEIKSYNNQVGIYEDTLTVQVGPDIRILPVRMAVVGSPLKFTGPQLASRSGLSPQNALSQFEFINFGSRLINPKPQALKSSALDSTKVSKRRTSNGTFVGPSSFEIFPKKVISVENHCPKQIRLEWMVYCKYSHKPDERIQLESILQRANKAGMANAGVLGISPIVMNIPPFGRAPLEIYFKNFQLGSYEAVALADIAYLEESGEKTYGPRRMAKRGHFPTPSKVLSSDTESIAFTDLDAIAKIRIKARCIEPKLSLDTGKIIRIKKFLCKGIEDDTVVAATTKFLVNRSEAQCTFTISAKPEGIFSVKPAKSSLFDKSIGVYQLSSQQQLMITVVYVGKDGSIPQNPAKAYAKVVTFGAVTIIEPKERSQQNLSSAEVDENPYPVASTPPVIPEQPIFTEHSITEQVILEQNEDMDELQSPTTEVLALTRRSSRFGVPKDHYATVSTKNSQPISRANSFSRYSADGSDIPVLTREGSNSSIKNRDSAQGRSSHNKPKKESAILLETGYLIISYTNGLTQEILIQLEAVFE